jgi:hypothetical protein
MLVYTTDKFKSDRRRASPKYQKLTSFSPEDILPQYIIRSSLNLYSSEMGCRTRRSGSDNVSRKFDSIVEACLSGGGPPRDSHQKYETVSDYYIQLSKLCTKVS